MINDDDLVGLAKSCVEICEVLRVGVEGKDIDDLSDPVQKAIADLKKCAHPNDTHSSARRNNGIFSTTNEIEEKVKEHAERHSIIRGARARYDKEMIQGWKLEIHTILGVFHVGRSYCMLFSWSPDFHPGFLGLRHKQQARDDGTAVGQSDKEFRHGILLPLRALSPTDFFPTRLRLRWCFPIDAFAWLL